MGNVVCYKVWYVAKGYAQKYGINYNKTTAPTARLESFLSHPPLFYDTRLGHPTN